MSLKRPRIIQCGHTNIDFRSKNDFEHLKLYEPWKVPKDFGTMGNSNYAPSYSTHKNLFEISKSRNRLKNIMQNSPDPREYDSIKFYKAKRINPLIVSEFRTERFAELDEGQAGKEKYTGDSMLYSVTYKTRKERQNKKALNELSESIPEKKDEADALKKLSEAKEKSNKEATTETQLVNLDVKETLEGKINIQKLKDIRNSLRRRFQSRSDVRKIFKEWGAKDDNTLTIYDIHKMLEKLSMPVNYNEVRAFIYGCNKRGTEDLNLSEFSEFINNEKDIMTDLDLKNIKFIDEKTFLEGEETEKLKNILQNNIKESSKNVELQKLKNHIKTRMSIINSLISNKNLTPKNMTKTEFTSVIRDLNLPEKFYRDYIVESIFLKHQNEDKETMNAAEFFEDCLSLKDPTGFSEFNARSLELLKDKIQKQINLQEERNLDYLECKKNAEKIQEGLNKVIEDKKKAEQKIQEEIDKNCKEVVNPQPSTAFINKVFKDHRKMFLELNKVEDSFSAKPNLVSKLVHSTRFSSNPPHKDTFYMINQDPRGSSFITEKERFNVAGLNSLSDFVREDKEKKRLMELGRLKKLRDFEKLRDKGYELFNRKNNLNAENRHSNKMLNHYQYNWNFKLNNDFVE